MCPDSPSTEHFGDSRIDALDAARLGELAQVGGKPGCIEMHGPVEMFEVVAGIVGWRRHAARARELRSHGVFIESSRIALLAQAIPQVVKRHRPRLEAEAAEGMHERLAFVLPAVELDGELDRAIGRLHDFEGVQAE